MPISAAHLLTQNVQRQPTRRHFCTRHLFHGSVRLRYRCPVPLSLRAQLLGTEIPHGNRIRLLRDGLQQSPIRFAVFHCFSHGIPGPKLVPATLSFRLSTVDYPLSSDLTLSLCTPSIQTYAHVCSNEHRGSPRPHSRSAPRRGRSSQARLTRDRVEVRREGCHPAPQFFRSALPRYPKCSRRTEARLAFTRHPSRSLRSRGPRRDAGVRG